MTTAVIGEELEGVDGSMLGINLTVGEFLASERDFDMHIGNNTAIIAVRGGYFDAQWSLVEYYGMNRVSYIPPGCPNGS